MRFLVLRKKRFWEKKKDKKIFLDDMEMEIAYASRVGKRVRRLAQRFDRVLSLDFKEFFVKSNLLFLLADSACDKIASRHGGVDRDILEVQVDFLNKEIIEKLISFALNVRRVLIHSDIKPENFDFLCSEAGVCPEFVQGDCKQNVVVVFGEEFLIKHLPTGKTYYDILPVIPRESDAYFMPEMNIIFSEYLRQNPEKTKHVKISDLMSK